MPPAPAPGSIAWTDLTVRDAEAIRDFYVRVAGCALFTPPAE